VHVSPKVPSAAGNRDATNVVHERVRRLILDGELEPGSEISQLELARQLEISRTPLREALRMLEREGLVVNHGPHKLMRVSSLSMQDLDDLYSLRVMGEGLAIWLTVPALRDEDFEDLERFLEIASVQSHRDFHRRLRIGAGERLREHLDLLFEHAERYQRAYRHRTSGDPLKLDEHRAIVDACRAHDRELARELMVEHTAGTAIGLMTAERHAPFTLPTAITMAKAGRTLTGAH
jgi:DNA-binding GntR family transcriptional regulator